MRVLLFFPIMHNIWKNLVENVFCLMKISEGRAVGFEDSPLHFIKDNLGNVNSFITFSHMTHNLFLYFQSSHCLMSTVLDLTQKSVRGSYVDLLIEKYSLRLRSENIMCLTVFIIFFLLLSDILCIYLCWWGLQNLLFSLSASKSCL